jgi:hypothetical protein
LLSARRVRVQILTLTSGIVDEDIDLRDLPSAHEVIMGPKCQAKA